MIQKPSISTTCQSNHQILCRFIGSLILLFVLIGNSYGQDRHFSQFYTSVFSNNAAYAGNLYEDIRFTAIHRSQWYKTGSAYATSGGAFDMNFEGGKLRDNKIGLGIHVVNDALISGYLDRKEIGLATAFHTPLDGIGRSFLGIGVQGTLTQMTISGPESYLWGSEFDEFNRPQQLTNAQVGEDFVGTSIMNIKLGAGINWKYHFSESWDVNAGISGYNLNRPVQTVYTIADSLNNNRSRHRYVFQINSRNTLSDRWDLEPSVIITDQASARNIITGTFFTYKSKTRSDQIRLAIGPWYRFGSWQNQQLANAVILASKLKVHHITVGLSYDVSVSQLNNITELPGVDANNVGAWEVSLVYVGLLKRPAPNDYTVPCKFF